MQTSAHTRVPLIHLLLAKNHRLNQSQTLLKKNTLSNYAHHHVRIIHLQMRCDALLVPVCVSEPLVIVTIFPLFQENKDISQWYG